MTSLVLSAQNPAFNLPDFPVARLAGLALAEAHLEHPEEPDDRIKGVVPLLEAALISFLRPSSSATFWAPAQRRSEAPSFLLLPWWRLLPNGSVENYREHSAG